MGQPHYDSGRGGLLPQPLHHLERGEAVCHQLDIQNSSVGMCSAHVYVLCVCVQVLSEGMQRVLVLCMCCVCVFRCCLKACREC